MSQLQRDNDPSALIDFRTPRFDLDSVYGAGPAAQPYLYDWADRARPRGQAALGPSPATARPAPRDRDLPRNRRAAR